MPELTDGYARSLLPARPEESDKSTFGCVLDIAGSENYRGAACLSAVAALRVGAGYATLAAPAPVIAAVAAQYPDVVLLPLKTRGGCVSFRQYRKVAPLIGRASAVAIGSGLSSLAGGTQSVRDFFARIMLILSGTDIPTVIDADGINFLSRNRTMALPRKAILTPHRKELSRLLRVDADAIDAERTGFAERAAREWRSVVVLKGRRTVITDGVSTFVNTTGNSALAKAGSGDVLAGMIAGLCAQGVSALNAACLGVFLHGRAGDLAAAEKTSYGVLASDLEKYISRAIASLI